MAIIIFNFLLFLSTDVNFPPVQNEMTWLVIINKTSASSRIFRVVEVERESSLHAFVRYFQPVTFARKKQVCAHNSLHALQL